MDRLLVKLWSNRVLEGLWLLTVLLVPIAFFDPDRFLSEAVIAYVEVPKIAILRTLVGLMAIVWLIEWGFTGRLPFIFKHKHSGGGGHPREYLGKFAAWLREKPTRWVGLAAWFFLATTLLSTILSTSFKVSLWGEVAGQDGFAAYNVVAYVILMGVISTRLKTRQQLWRLMATLTLVGVLISGYAVLQHYGRDFLGILEATGGGRDRVTSFMGNAVFAAAAMLMPISITLVLAAVTLSRLTAAWAPLRNIGSRAAVLTMVGTWTLLLTIQLLGLVFTQGRGSWLGTILALVTFLVLASIFGKWRLWGWTIPVLALSVFFTWAILQWSGIILVLDAGFWVSIATGAIGFLVLVTIFGGINALSRAARGIQSAYTNTTFADATRPRTLRWLAGITGLAVFVGLLVVLTLPQFGLEEGTGDLSADVPITSEETTPFNVQGRFVSISDEVLSGNFSKRGAIWLVSLQLMQERPWFPFDTLSLPWVRPFIGYGPDLFRYTFLLESPTSQDKSRLPLEPDHAHNFFLHQAVEQGFLGLASSFSIFLAAFIVGGYQLMRQRNGYSDVHTLVLISLLAVLAGRFLEQTAGVARISDLTLFWVILAVLTALPTVMLPSAEAESSPGSQIPAALAHRVQRRSRSRSASKSYDWQQFIRLAIVAWAAGGILAVTWEKTLNHPQAGIAGGDALRQFREGDYQGSIASLDHAIGLAPDVSTYHTSKAAVYAAYLRNTRIPRDPQCTLEADDLSYRICLGKKIYTNNFNALEQRPYYWRARLALANSALALGLEEEAIRLYQETVALAPSSWPLQNLLAEVYIDVGQPAAALEVLESSLTITKRGAISDQAFHLRETAQQQLDDMHQPEANSTIN